jgi:hypothetical protein
MRRSLPTLSEDPEAITFGVTRRTCHRGPELELCIQLSDRRLVCARVDTRMAHYSRRRGRGRVRTCCIPTAQDVDEKYRDSRIPFADERRSHEHFVMTPRCRRNRSTPVDGAVSVHIMHSLISLSLIAHENCYSPSIRNGFTREHPGDHRISGGEAIKFWPKTRHTEIGGRHSREEEGQEKGNAPGEARRPRRKCEEFLCELAPQAGLEPATLRLTAGCSAIELLRNLGGNATSDRIGCARPDARTSPI